MQIQLFVGNHGRRYAVEDHIKLIQQVLGARGVEVQIVEELHDAKPTLIIDEFTNLAVNRDIRAFKAANPNIPIVVLLTEFIEKKWGVTSFNLFGSISTAAAAFCLEILARLRRPDFSRSSALKWVQCLFYAPFAAIYLFQNRKMATIAMDRGQVDGDLKRLAYMHIRFLGLQSMVDCLDGVILMHEKIATTHLFGSKTSRKLCDLGVIYPEFDIDAVMSKFWVDKHLGFEITGSMTRHRCQWLRRIGRDILGAGLINTYEPINDRSFKQTAQASDWRASYSLHPPQSGPWPYSSPARLFRAITEDGSLPVLTRSFNQNPIEELGIVYKGMETLVELREMHQNREHTRLAWAQHMMKYNKCVGPRNDLLVRALCDLIVDGSTK